MNDYNPFSDNNSPFDEIDSPLDDIDSPQYLNNNKYFHGKKKSKFSDREFYKLIFISSTLVLSSIFLISYFISKLTESPNVEAEKEVVTIYIEKDPIVTTTSTSTTSTTTTVPLPPPTLPIESTNIEVKEDQNKFVEINHEEVLQKTVQVIAEECIADSYGTAVETYVGMGSGVIISEDGYIITNSHVVEDCVGEIFIATVEDVDSSTEIKYIADIISYDTYLDLALLKIRETVSGARTYQKFEYFELLNSSEVNLGETLFIYGYPSVTGDGSTYSLNINLTKGTVSGFESQDKYKRAWIVTDADISYGNSGGAALDQSGKLIGIPTFGSTEGASWIGYLRTMDVVIDWVSEYVTVKESIDITAIPRLKIAEIDLSAIPKYQREDWNTWDDIDSDCQNTRHEVLQLESYVNVLFTNSGSCFVSSGKWFDPYNGTFYFFSGDLDVDHFIPLYNAHISGAWSWSIEKKVRFANNLDDPDLLIAVNSFTNREKSAYGPEDWKPDNTRYWCEYAYDWIRIKYEWGLTATQREWSALLEMIETCPKDFTFEDAINNSHIFSDEKIERYKH